MASSHSQTRVFHVSIDQVKKIILDPTFCSELNFSFKSENPGGSGVWYRFHHGTSFSSWGEKITVTLTPLAFNQVEVRLLSECGMPTQVFDMGKNKSNVEVIFSYISRKLTERTVSYKQPAESKRFCRQCGRQLSAEAVFCGNCGTRQN